MNDDTLRLGDPDDRAAGFVPAVHALRYSTPEVSFDPREKNGIVARLVPPGSRVLDVGCGTGATLRHLRDAAGCDVVGLEPNQARAAVGVDQGVPIHAGTLGEVDRERLGTFDCVMFLDVLEHIASPHEVLAEAARLLRPEGRVIVSVPNVAHWSVRWALLRGRFDYTDAGIMDATHLRWFTRKTATAMLVAAGYELRTYQVTAGTWLAAYHQTWPWKWLPKVVKAPLIRLGAQLAPTLCGAQHVLSGKPRMPMAARDVGPERIAASSAAQAR